MAGLALIWHRRSIEVCPISEKADSAGKSPAASASSALSELKLRRWEHPAGQPWYDAPDLIAREFGEWLKQRNWAGLPWHVVLPREDVVVRAFELPVVTDAELPSLVKFQAVTRSSVPIEQLALDFIPLPERPQATVRDVLAVSWSKGHLNALAQVAELCGAPLQTVGMTSSGVAELVDRLDPRASAPAGPELFVLRDLGRVEVVIRAAGALMFAHAARLPEAASPGLVLQEVSRAIVAAETVLAHRPFAQVVLLDVLDEPELATLLNSRIGLPPTDLGAAWKQRSSGLNSPTAWGAARAVEPRSGRQIAAWDLLHPRQPPPVRDPWKPRRAAIGAGVLAVATIGAMISQQTLAALDAELMRTVARTNELDGEIKAAKTLLDSHAAIKNWQDLSIQPLREFADLEAAVDDDTSNLYLSDMNITVGNGDVVNRVFLGGQARSRQSVQEAQRHLGGLGRWRVGAPKIDPSSRDVDYGYRFEVTTDLLRLPAVAAPKPGTTASTGTRPPAAPAPVPATSSQSAATATSPDPATSSVTHIGPGAEGADHAGA